MIYAACQTKGCPNNGAPYTVESDEPETLGSCPHCGKDLKRIDAPILDPAPLVEEEPTPEPTKAELLAAARANATAQVKSRLASTDEWAARAYEDGVPISPDRVKHRQALRGLFAEIEKSNDPAAIEIPDPPAAPKPKK